MKHFSGTGTADGVNAGAGAGAGGCFEVSRDGKLPPLPLAPRPPGELMGEEEESPAGVGAVEKWVAGDGEDEGEGVAGVASARAANWSARDRRNSVKKLVGAVKGKEAWGESESGDPLTSTVMVFVERRERNEVSDAELESSLSRRLERVWHCSARADQTAAFGSGHAFLRARDKQWEAVAAHQAARNRRARQASGRSFRAYGGPGLQRTRPAEAELGGRGKVILGGVPWDARPPRRDTTGVLDRHERGTRQRSRSRSSQHRLHIVYLYLRQSACIPRPPLPTPNPDTTMDAVGYVATAQEHLRSLKNTRLAALRPPGEFFDWQRVSKPANSGEFMKRAGYNM